ncbi:MAG: hypothetical protein RBT49_06920 [Bacteroidales bacterium]|jgi:hypothetical protein|nr:hypothetical protein [Bacteroidales bacterium]
MIRYIIILLTFFPTVTFSEIVTLNDAINVAINYYRGNIVPEQFNKKIITDYVKAINPESIQYKIDSLVIEDITVSYYFNFKPTGVLIISKNLAFEQPHWFAIEGHADLKQFEITHRGINGNISTFSIDKSRSNFSYNSRTQKPKKEAVEKWNRYKINPNDFNPEITNKGKVSFQNVRNVAINYYRQNTAPNQYHKGIISDYNEAIRLKNIKYEVDSLVIENKTVCYYFNFKPKGTIEVNAVYSIEPVSGWSEEGNINIKQAYLHRNDPGVISLIQFDTSNRRYQKYNDLPTYEIMLKWNEYQVDPKIFKLENNGADVTPDGGNLDYNDSRE